MEQAMTEEKYQKDGQLRQYLSQLLCLTKKNDHSLSKFTLTLSVVLSVETLWSGLNCLVRTLADTRMCRRFP